MHSLGKRLLLNSSTTKTEDCQSNCRQVVYIIILNYIHILEWPPNSEEQDKMQKDSVRRIKDLKSPSYIHEYTDENVFI